MPVVPAAEGLLELSSLAQCSEMLFPQTRL